VKCVLESVLIYIRKLALAFWIGEMLFFIVIFAPRVFKVLEKPVAAQLQASIFPAYYLAGVICAVLVLISLILSRVLNTKPSHSPKRYWITLGLTMFAGAIFVYSRWSITPDILQIQPILYSPDSTPQAIAEARGQFDVLHKLSVQSNGSALIALLILLFLL